MTIAFDLFNVAAMRYAVQGAAVSQPAANFIKEFYKTNEGLQWVDENNLVTLAIISDPQSLSYNTIQPTTGDYTPLTLRGYGTTPAVDIFVVKEGATGTTKFVIDDDGQVGIGTATPSEELDVVGTIETFFSISSRSGEAHDTYGYWDPSGAAGGDLRTIRARAEYDSADANTSGQLSTYFGLAWVTSAGISDIENILLRSENQAAGTCVNFSDVYIETAVNSGGGAITNYRGLYIEDQTVASNNYSIFTNIGNVVFNSANGAGNVTVGATPVSVNYDLGLVGDGVLMLKETTTPTADTNYGKLYTQSDNSLYFQDGAGTEHIVHGFPIWKSYTITTQGLGANPDVYAAGFYEFAVGDPGLNQGNLTQAIGAANLSHAAHAFIVSDAAGTVDTGVVGLKVTGISITDGGTRNAADEEVLLADITAATADTYYETTKKWLGAPVFTLYTVSGSPTTYNIAINYGLVKYEDFGNNDFTVSNVEAVGLGGAADNDFDIIVMHHKASGWTYNNGAFTPVIAANTIASLVGDHATDDKLADDDHFAWKRTGLSTAVTGSSAEGVIFIIVSTANNAVEYCNLHLGIEY